MQHLDKKVAEICEHVALLPHTLAPASHASINQSHSHCVTVP